jgi:Ice-binding-like/Secretion system C-terminal sorting domain
MNRYSRYIGAILAAALMDPVCVVQAYNNPLPVPLLTAGTYYALAYSGITGSATVQGDIGTTTAAIDVTVVQTGTNYGIGGSHNAQAQTDLAAALTDAFGRTPDATISAALGGQTLTRGVYDGGALDLASNTTLTLSGSATDVFILRAASTITINTNSTVALSGGAVWSNVFWYVGSSATILSGTTFNGTILAVTSITLNASAVLVTGRLLAHGGAVTINSNVLPVELTSFTAAVKNGAVELHWNTNTEVNNYGFDVQRSQTAKCDAQNSAWTNVGFVHGAGTSNAPKDYSFVDRMVPFVNYAYRLKQVDNDGMYTYSAVVEVNAAQMPGKLWLGQNYPNPFNPATKIRFGVNENTHATVTIFNGIGEKVSTLFNDDAVSGEVYDVQFNGTNLAGGIYYCRLQTHDATEVKNLLLIK